MNAFLVLLSSLKIDQASIGEGMLGGRVLELHLGDDPKSDT